MRGFIKFTQVCFRLCCFKRKYVHPCSTPFRGKVLDSNEDALIVSFTVEKRLLFRIPERRPCSWNNLLGKQTKLAFTILTDGREAGTR